jgi:hypothetical protein
MRKDLLCLGGIELCISLFSFVLWWTLGRPVSVRLFFLLILPFAFSCFTSLASLASLLSSRLYFNLSLSLRPPLPSRHPSNRNLIPSISDVWTPRQTPGRSHPTWQILCLRIDTPFPFFFFNDIVLPWVACVRYHCTLLTQSYFLCIRPPRLSNVVAFDTFFSRPLLSYFPPPLFFFFTLFTFYRNCYVLFRYYATYQRSQEMARRV